MAGSVTAPVLATVTGAEGSTPQKPGSSAIFVNGELISGTVGGGIVERRTQEYSLRCGMTKESHYFHYALNKDITENEEAICGGTITILIDANPLDFISVYSEIEKSVSEREPGVLITKVTGKDDSGLNINRYWITATRKPDLPAFVADKIEPLVSSILSSSYSDSYRQLDITVPGERSESTFFLEPVFPLPQLIIAGAGHIGKALSHLGKMLDFDVTVIDNRYEYANRDNLPDADHIIVKDIGQAIEEVEKRSDTYIVIVTRGHIHDTAALRPCIGSDAGYIGMIGSRAKVAKMHADFIQKGWASEEQWNRIYTPIGLNIKSKTVEEIAVSIAAQLIMVKNSKVRD